MENTVDFINLTRDLCQFNTGIVARDNEKLFARIASELPTELYRYPSRETHLGWVIPDLWEVNKATIHKDGKLLFDGKSNDLGVAHYSKSFQGKISFEDLKEHVSTNPNVPEAYIFHCRWLYRPWAPGWAFCIPYEIYKEFGPGNYQVDLQTSYSQSEMLVADYTHQGESDQTIVFHTNTCHPHMANDGFAGTAVMIRFFQWLQGQKTRYSYRLVMSPEHIGTVFYLAGMSKQERSQLKCGVFGEIMGTEGPFKVASSFFGDHILDRAFRNAVRHYTKQYSFVGWRKSIGNDETVWEAPGYEIPFVQVNRCNDEYPFREYHTNLDTPELAQPDRLMEFYEIFKKVFYTLENNCTLQRAFEGIVCLSNPQYNLYHDRMDPSVKMELDANEEKWGYLNDCILRYFDNQHTVLDIAELHELPFDQMHRYLKKYEKADLVQMHPSDLNTQNVFSTNKVKRPRFENFNETSW